MKWKAIYDGQSCGIWISEPLHNGDWPYWLILEFINLKDATCSRYCVELCAVSPAAAGDENCRKAMKNCGDGAVVDASSEQLVEALHSYGIKAPLWCERGNSRRKLMREAKKQAKLCRGLFGFYMDGPKNALGNTGWDFIQGDIG